MRTRKYCCPVLLLLISIVFFSACTVREGNSSVIIFCIGDGMGDEQIKGASLYKTGEEGSLSFQSFPVKGKVSTRSADNSITDSAAAATAMATGQKVNNGVISTAIPGDRQSLTTILESALHRGMRTGLVTTAFLTHATPAAFAAHTASRNNYNDIAGQYLRVSRPDILMGGGGIAYAVDPAAIEHAGYTLLTDRASLNTLMSPPLAGIFGDDHMPYEWDGLGVYPHLNEMALYAAETLDQDSDGFFLLVEGGRIDHACHANDIERAVFETLEFDNTVQQLLLWAQGREDVLIIVTADHETGGLSVTSDNGALIMPGVSWSTNYHTGVDVSYFVWGDKSVLFSSLRDNTGFYGVMKGIIENQY